MKSTRIERARSYLAKMPVAVSGQGGHTSAFKAICAAAVGFDLSEDEALAALADWNTDCQPPWSERELRHKIASARRNCKRPAGFLLKEQGSARPSTASDFEGDNERKARLRSRWPAFQQLTDLERDAVAQLRRLPQIAVLAATRIGVLSGASVDGYQSFVLHEGTFAQARRLDGQPYRLADGRQTKAKNLPGSQGAFIGQNLLGGPTTKVLLVEGVIALLEALAAYEIVCPTDDWTILAATSAVSRFERAPKLLARLANRFIRIVPDNEPDGAGHQAAAAWLAELEALRCGVEVRALPEGIKDLGPLIAYPVQYHKNLHALFQ